MRTEKFEAMNTIQQTKFDNVMIIDDNTMDLYISRRNILKYFFAKNVLQYSSATDALKFLTDNQGNTALLPQIIFVDIYMPIMSGFEFMDAFDNFPSVLKEQCRAYIISSSIDKNDIARANEDKNIIAFREKPLTKEFLETITTF